jgi:hypothetical protein
MRENINGTLIISKSLRTSHGESAQARRHSFIFFQQYMKSGEKAQLSCKGGHCHTWHCRRSLVTIQQTRWQKGAANEYERGLRIGPFYNTLAPEEVPGQASLAGMLRC